MSSGTNAQASAGDQLRLVAAAAHELKAPLTIILHLAAELQDQRLAGGKVEQLVAVQRIQYSAERTLRLVQDLITSYRVTQSDQLAFALPLEPVNAVAVCEEAAAELLPLARSHDQKIMLTASRPRLVVANRQLLHSVFFNLIDNAIRHNPPQTEVQINARRQHDLVRVRIRDSGPGISRGEFQRLRASIGRQLQPLTSRSSGSGLGLFIAGQLAASMGGRLGLGRPARGADFHVDLLSSKQLTLF